MNPLISLIIPIYNVESYLTECLESVRAQTYQNLEVLLINDGSTDASAQIAADFAAKNSHFIKFDKENGGLSDARNYGLDRCRGEYIVFIDSDDLVSPYYVENLLDALQAAKVKLAMCKMTRVAAELSNQLATQFDKISGDFKTRIKSLGINQDQMPNDAAWDKIYHRSLFEEIRYPKGQVFEDSRLIFPLLDLAGDYVIVDSLDYFYRPNDASITGQEITQQNFDLFTKNERQISFLLEKHPEALNFGLTNVLNANDYWAQVAIRDKNSLAAQFFDQIWQQNKVCSKNLGTRRFLYSSKTFYRLTIGLAAWLYSNQTLKKLMKKFLMKN